MLRRLVRPLFLLIGLGFVAVAGWRGVMEADGTRIPGPGVLALALAVVTAGLLLGSNAWLVLFPEIRDRRDFRYGFFVAQLGKYVPGSVWQAAGQIGFARGGQVSLGQSSSRFLTSAVMMVVAGGAVGSLSAFTCEHCGGWLRIAAAAAVAPMVLLHPRAVALVLEHLDRSAPATRHHVPPADQRWRCFAWSTSSVVANAVAFAFLADAATAGGVGLPGTVTVFALAWTVGYVALPFPSGIGVREAVLVALAPPGLGAGAVVAASLAHRLTSLAAEVSLIGATSVPNIWARRRRASTR